MKAAIGLLVLALVASGCATKPASVAPPVCGAGSSDPACQVSASPTTGIIRGVVIDAAVKPLAGVKVSLAVQGAKGAVTNTSVNGLFAFSGLAPGTYFVRAEKDGYVTGQTSADVVAGDANPKTVKIQLTTDLSKTPYFTQYKFDGYIECSFSLVAVGLAACAEANGVGPTTDNFITEYTLDREPSWTQSEMVWQSTQAVSSELNLDYSYNAGQALLTNYVNVHGNSPLTGYANRTAGHEVGLGTNTTLLIRVFNEPVNGTRPPNPTGPGCLPRPDPVGGCFTGVGATVEQTFTIYTTVFYGYQPPPGWTFVAEGSVPPPAT
ncbi:MAG: carboxypeptidase-like regulatory domain-containing protein [Thermoplasmatota archaeon]